MEHDCTRSGEFEKLEIVYKTVMGNGKEGLYATTIRLQEGVKELTQTVTAVTTSMNAFNRFQIETESAIRENERHKTNKKWLVNTLIAVSSVAIAFIALFIHTRGI